MDLNETLLQKETEMFTKNVHPGVYAAAALAEVVVNVVNNKRNKRLTQKCKQLEEERVALKRRVAYLSKKLDDNQIPITEFEAIIFSNF